VVDTVVVHNMPVPGYTLPGSPPVVDTVVIHDMPVPDDTLPVNPSEPIEEPATGMGPSTIAIGEPNPATPNPDDPGMTTPGKPSVSVMSDTKEATSAYPDTPFMIIPGSPPVSVLIADEEATSGTSNAPLCRETRSNAICDEVIDPVRCGPANCMYGNLCLGIGAGFLETDCGSAR
jgi:hypothetical protein